MVDLPQVPRRLAVTEAPSSPLTADAVASPYANLGRAMDKLGGALEDVGVDMAKEAGKRAVTMDGEGNLSVQAVPPLGKAAEAFNRTAQMTYLSQLEPAVKAKVLEARLKFDGKPQAFQDWADQYGGELVSGQPSDDLAHAVGLLVDQHASVAYQGLALARHSQDVQNNRVVLKDFLDDKDNTAAQLAQAGGTDSLEYKQIIADYVTRQQQAQTDPSLNYTKEKAAADLRDLTSRHGALAVVGAVRRIAEDKSYSDDGTPNGGPIKAKERAESLITDERFGHLSPEQRLQYNKLALGQIRALTADGQVAIANLNQEATKLDELLKNGGVAPATIDDFKSRAAEAGATKALAKVIQADALSKTYPWFSALPSEDRANFINGQTGRPDPRGILDKFENAESNGNPNARSSTSSALGSLQFTRGTWLTLIRQSRPDIAAGKTDDELLALRTDRNLSRDLAAVNNRQNAAIFAGQGIFPSEGRLYLAHLLGPRDAVAVAAADPKTPLQGLIWDKAIIANPDLMRKYSTAGEIQDWANRKMGQAPSAPAAVANLKPTEHAAYLQFAQAKAAEDLTAHLGTVKKAVDAGFAPNARDIDELGALVHAVGTDHQKQQVAELGALAEFGSNYSNATPQARASIRTEISENYRSSGSKVLSNFLTYADQIDKQVTQSYATAPYDASVRYGGRPALSPIDPDNPAGLARALQDRVDRQAIFRIEQSLPPTSVLDPAEANAWKNALAHGDVGLSAAFLQNVGNLPPEIAAATQNSKPIVEGVTGMVNSRSPDRMEIGFAAVDKIWRDNPQVAEASFGKTVIDRMQIWQGLRDGFSPAEIAERFMTVDDPGRATAREQLRKIAEKETDAMVPADVASKFARGTYGLRWATGGAANVPSNDLTAQQLSAEFKSIRTALRTYGVDADKADELAFKRLEQSWGPSAVNGNQVMKYPPEKYYPNIGRSYAWLNDEVTAAAEKFAGPRFTISGTRSEYESGPGTGAIENWKVVGLAASPGAAARIARRQPPAYAIVIQKRNGVLETVRDTSTGAVGVTFDPTPYLDRYEKDMRNRETFVKRNHELNAKFGRDPRMAFGVQP